MCLKQLTVVLVLLGAKCVVTMVRKLCTDLKSMRYFPRKNLKTLNLVEFNV